jgi:hypothetical protein
VWAIARKSTGRFKAFLTEPDVSDFLDFLLGPVRLVPWRAATVFGAILGLELVVSDLVTIPGQYIFATWVGVATCLAAGLVGARRGREFYHGILVVFVAILVANLIDLLYGLAVIWAATSAGTASASLVRDATDLPLPGMVLLGLPVGTVGAGIAAWLGHRASLSRQKT